MKCKNCGMELRANARFCDICGEPAPEQQPYGGMYDDGNPG